MKHIVLLRQIQCMEGIRFFLSRIENCILVNWTKSKLLHMIVRGCEVLDKTLSSKVDSSQGQTCFTALTQENE